MRRLTQKQANTLQTGGSVARRYVSLVNIAYEVGDATRPEVNGAKVIVHVCNDVGGWGRGFVVALSRRWPEPEQQFRAWYRGGLSQPFALGEVQFVSVAPDTTVANLIGQHGLAARQRIPPVRYDAIRLGLRSVATFALEQSASVHMPRIGCGLAGGRWDKIEPIITDELSGRGIPVTVYDLPTTTSRACGAIAMLFQSPRPVARSPRR